jgi:hypothetical protein
METILFGFLSLPLAALSWRPLFSLKHHGFYRWVMWECVLWLAIRNHRHLLVERFDLQQLISSVLMTASLLNKPVDDQDDGIDAAAHSAEPVTIRMRTDNVCAHFIARFPAISRWHPDKWA